MQDWTRHRAGCRVGQWLWRAGFALSVAIGSVFLSSGSTARAAEAACSPVKDVHFICGVTNVEDFIAVPGTQWVFGSDLAAAPPGHLYLFDTKTHRAHHIEPSSMNLDKKRFPDCPGPIDPAKFVSHGVDLTPPRNGKATLYVVNHGGRESVEAFDVDLTKGAPKIAWVGCVVAPPKFWPDAVAALPDGGMIVTSLWDPTDPNRVQKLSNGEVVGALDEWHAGKGWSPVPGSEGMSGPNGVIVSPDGKTVFIGVWSGHNITRIKLGGGKPEVKSVPTKILTDNVRWSPDHKTVYAGGQDATVKQVLECFESSKENCDVPFKIYAMDPESMKLKDLVPSGVYGVLGAGTGAIRNGNELWVSTFRADRIGIFPMH